MGINQDCTAPRKHLFLELWGLGDAVLMMPALQAAIQTGDSVTVLAKPASRSLLEPALPTVNWIEWTAPWTAFRGKYRLWQWNWLELIALYRKLRSEQFTDGWSARPDPRDHLLLWLIGARQRRSFRHRWSGPFLNAGLDWPTAPRHRSADWQAIAEAAGLGPTKRPTLPAAAYASNLPNSMAKLPKPWIVLHTGAAQPTRRWPEPNWRCVIEALQAEFAFSLILIPDPTGHGESLSSLANVTLCETTLPQLVATLATADAVLAHDSGPAHLAAALDTPVFAVMGPNLPERFSPRHPQAAVLHDPQCPHFPCRDYCHFDEPHCLTRLTAEHCLTKLMPWLEDLLRPADTNSLNHANE